MALKSFNCQGETGLGPFAAVLQSVHLHTSPPPPPATNYKNDMGLKITICTTVGANSEPQETKTKKYPNAISEEPRAKNLGIGSKSRVQGMPYFTHHHKRVGKPHKPPLQPDP